MWKFFQANKNGTPLEICNGLGDNPTLVTESGKTINAHWKSVDITTATTTTVVEVIPNESILLTDLVVILTKKVAASTIIPRFSDGTITVNLLTFEGENDAIHFSHAFQGGLRGWKDADFQIVTNAATTVAVLVGYVHVSADSTKTYSVWNAER